MTPAERVASDIWRRLRQAASVGARLGEETLTDLLVLDMLPHQRMNGFGIRHPTKAREFRIGADVLLIVRYPDGSGRRLALQAKRLYGTGHYGALAYKDASETRQIDKLERFARLSGAVPAYLLYNHVDPLPSETTHWHCCRPHDPAQFGCTLVPSGCIREAIRRRGCRRFRPIHVDKATRPWRCVFDCPRSVEPVDGLARLRPDLPFASHEGETEGRSPDWIRTDSDGFEALLEIDGPISATDLRGVLPGFVQAQDEEPWDAEWTYPRRVLVVDVGDFGEELDSE